ncbi:MAG: hypothetical protein DCC73_02815 [Proteobacteria bacterium]|nr:MAG: hypothetical protein DCC73_02815 [Pseudomonadota bacterium]
MLNRKDDDHIHHTIQMIDRLCNTQNIDEFMETSLRDLICYLDADTACAFELFTHAGRPWLGKATTINMTRDVLREYNSTFVALDPICGTAYSTSGNCTIRPNGAKLMRVSDHLDLSNKQDSLYFNEFLHQENLDHVLGIMIRPSIPKLPVVVLGFQRDDNRPDFTESDFDRARFLISALVSRVENFALHHVIGEMKQTATTKNNHKFIFEIKLDQSGRLEVISLASDKYGEFVYSPSITYFPGLQHALRNFAGRTLRAKDISCFLSSIGLSNIPESYQVQIKSALGKDSLDYILVADPPQQDSAIMSWARIHKITARELELVACIAEGMRNAEIAEKLNVSVRTVENHLRSIFSKSAVSSRTQLLHQLLVTNNINASDLKVV